MKKTIISLFALVFIYFCTPTPQEAPNTFTDSRDSKVYKTVTIGNQVWMAENLAYLPSVVGPATGSTTDPHYYVYDYDGTDVDEAKATTNYQTYGVLYNWPAALTACPEGWYLPCDEEWTLLEIYLANNGHNFDGTIGGDYFRSKIAKSLASDTGWNYWDIEGAPGNTDYPEYINKSGFSALPGGYRNPSGAFFGIGVFSFWWSSTKVFTRNCVWRRAMNAGDSPIYKVCSDYSRGYSVRCLRENNLPSVTTGLVTNVTKTTASFSVTVTGVSSVTARGVCWSTSENPTTSDSKTTDGTGIGPYTSNITGLSPNTTYYVRAYATNTNGIAYGQQRSFITQNEQGPVFGNFTDFRDGNQYKTVIIGWQVWMAENLAYLPSVVGPATGSTTDPHYYVYDYDGTDVNEATSTENYQTYGVLYNWPAAITACPDGWHLPSDADWKQLEMYLGMSEEEADKWGERGTDEGGKLKEVGTTHWETPNTGATNSSGFTALPGGDRNWFNGDFGYIGHYAAWWSSTEDYGVVYRRLYYYDSYVTRYSLTKRDGASVRCVQGNALPIVTTGDVSDVGMNTATCAGNVIADGGAAVTARGVCWSTSENPSTSDSKTTDGEGIGDFTSNLTGLSQYTIYYVRAYATNSEGTVYGEQKMFRTSNNDVAAEWALFCGDTGEKTWVWDDVTGPGVWGNGGYKGCAAPCWWVVPISDINDQAPGEGAGASMTFTIVGARLIKNYNDGTSQQGSFTFDMSKITLDDGGNVWAKGKLNTKNVTVLCGKSPNEGNSPVYNYDILKLTENNMVLSYPEPGVGSWGTAWFWMFRKE